jgi:hypothetical protein
MTPLLDHFQQGMFILQKEKGVQFGADSGNDKGEDNIEDTTQNTGDLELDDIENI